jgi:HK97 family phage portal protein
MQKKLSLWKRAVLGVTAFKEAVILSKLPRSSYFGGTFRNYRGTPISIEADPYNSLLGWAYFAVDKVAQRVAGFEPELYNLARNGDVEQIEDHELLSLLYRANPTMTRSDFFYIVGGLLRVFGAAPVYLDRATPNGRATAIWPLRPDLLRRDTDKDGNLRGYTYRVGSETMDMAVNDVINIRRPSLANNAAGSSPLFSASLEVDADLQAAVWNKFIIENGAEPSGVLETEQEIDDESFERVREQWEARHAGASNAGKTAILEKGLKYNKISQSQKELDFVESRKFNRDTILTLLGVPTSLINDTANRANAETAERTFNKETIEPTIRLIVDQLNEFLIPQFDENLWLGFAPIVTDDAEVMRADHVAGINNWLTPNEVRAERNLPPLDGGDFIYRSIAEIPTIGDNIPEEIIEPVEGEAARAQIGKKVIAFKVKQDSGFMPVKHRKIKAAILARTHRKRAFNALVEEKLAQKIKTAFEGGKIKIKVKSRKDKDDEDPNGGLPENIAIERKAYLKKLPRRMVAFRRMSKKFFDEQEAEVMKNLEDVGDPKSFGIVDVKAADFETKADSWISKVVFDTTKAISVLVKMSKPIYKQTATEGGKDIASFMGVPYEDIHETPAAIKYMDTKPLKFAKEVNATTMEALRETLKEALSEGEGIGEVGNRIAEVFDMARGFRTEAIARTEVGSALNFGRNTEMVEQGVEKKRWISIFSNSRDDHMEAHGQVVDVKDSFEVGGESLEYPQDPSGSPANTVNCQCSESPVFDRS